jgi:hypothetical protein
VKNEERRNDIMKETGKEGEEGHDRQSKVKKDTNVNEAQRNWALNRKEREG